MPFDRSSSTDLAPYVAYVCTDEGAAVARAVMNRDQSHGANIYAGGLSGAARLTTDIQVAQTVLAELGNIPVEMAAECVDELRRTGANVIVLGSNTDIETYRALIKAGALEYFAFPASADEILAVQSAPLSNVIEIPQKAVLCPSIAVMGSNGGVGASLLAQNLAFHASGAKGAEKRTALIDADLQFGSQAIDLDRDETLGMFEGLIAPDRLDGTFFNATMDHINDHLSMYSHQVRIGQEPQPYEQGLSQLLPPLRSEFAAVVTDLPRSVFMQSVGILDHIDALVLLIPAGFSGVNAATRLIARIKAQTPDLRILPVLSELRKDAGLSRKDVISTIGHELTTTLPRCDTPLMRAHRSARPLVQSQPRGPYAKSVSAIWDAALADAKIDDSAKPSILKRIFK